jgi:hypothetical protein
MTVDDDEIQNALLAIYSRLGTVEGKVTLNARADRERLIPILEAKIRKTPLIGQIYLALDGKRNQVEVQAKLEAHGITTTGATISRRLTEMSTEYGIADEVPTPGAGKTYRRDRAMEDILNLSKRTEDWLKSEGAVAPKEAPKRRRKRSSK